MTVWCVHPTGRDNSAALSFGDLKYINTRYVYGDELANDGQIPHSFLFNIRQAAHRFDTGADYLLLDGDHVQIVAFTSELLQLYTQFRMLRWDRKAEAYYPVLIKPDEHHVPA